MFAHRGLVRALALMLFVAVACGQVLTDGLVSDREALLSLRNAVTDFGNSKIATWRPTGNPCFPKPWRHVLCGGGRVLEVNLANLQVAGSLPGKLRLASRMITLNLQGNRFTGGLPGAWADRTSFPRLRVLNLADNELSGELPNWNRAGAWRALQVVDLSNNNLHGGLPTNWLGKQRAIRNVQFLDLSRNNLGRANGTVSGAALAKTGADGWCPTERDAGLYTGTGWCPEGAPIAGTTASLVTLDLSDNGLSGEIPTDWPTMFPQLQYLMLQFNTLGKKDSGTDRASILPPSWSSDRRKAFPALSILTLYPGNEYICSIPDSTELDPNGFINVNNDATYQVVDSGSEAYGNENPRLCPTRFTDDNPVDSVATFTTTTATWTMATYATVQMDPAVDIWGFKVNIEVLDREGGTWGPLDGWNPVYLRTYTKSDDGGAVASGLDCTTTPGTCALTFLTAKANPVFGYEDSKAKISVAVVNLDGVESTTKSSAELTL